MKTANFLLLTLLYMTTTLHLHAMQQAPKITNEPIEELLERTKKFQRDRHSYFAQPTTQECYELFQSQQWYQREYHKQKHDLTIIANPDETKIAFIVRQDLSQFLLSVSGPMSPWVTVIDQQKKTILYTTELDTAQNRSYIALSANGGMIAVAYKNEHLAFYDPFYISLNLYTFDLHEYKEKKDKQAADGAVSAKIKKTLPCPTFIQLPDAMSFNRQGTDIILWHTNASSWEEKVPFNIIPLHPHSVGHNLAQLPSNVLQLIEHFLMSDYETKHEFSTRAAHTIERHLSSRDLFQDCVTEHILYALNYDETKFLTLDSTYQNHKPCCIVMDRTTEKKEDKIIAQFQLDDYNYRCIALSTSGNKAATFFTKKTADNNEETGKPNQYLSIHKIDQNKTLIIPCDYTATALCFNRQGTELIVRCNDYGSITIHPTTSLHLHPPRINFSEKPSLNNYLEQKYICKKIENSTQQPKN